jgi:hypothetical protein
MVSSKALVLLHDNMPGRPEPSTRGKQGAIKAVHLVNRQLLITVEIVPSLETQAGVNPTEGYHNDGGYNFYAVEGEEVRHP